VCTAAAAAAARVTVAAAALLLLPGVAAAGTRAVDRHLMQHGAGQHSVHASIRHAHACRMHSPSCEIKWWMVVCVHAVVFSTHSTTRFSTHSWSRHT
jgi:methionine aminopeptidase